MKKRKNLLMKSISLILCVGFFISALGIPSTISAEEAQYPDAVESLQKNVVIADESGGPIYLMEGQIVEDADLLAGLSAVDELENEVDIYIQDVDGLNIQKAEMKENGKAYVITYRATHPETGEVFTKVREAYVSLKPVLRASSPLLIDLTDSDIDLEAAALASGGKYTYSGASKEIVINAGPVTITGSTTERKISINGTTSVILSDVEVSSGNPIDIKNGADVTLNLVGTNSLIGSVGSGIHLPTGSSLTIEGSGDLTVEAAASFFAGIGGGFYETTGTLTINGGNITARGGHMVSGIGAQMASSIVNINGGFVTAYGGGGAAGIGGGYNNEAGTVNISGGTVIAINGGATADDIGRGQHGTGGTINITGGSVYAKDGLVHPQPVNGAGVPVYQNNLTIKNPALGDGVSIPTMSYDGDTSYGLNDVVTSNGGKVFFWLPQNSDPTAKVEVLPSLGEYYSYTWARTGTTETQTLLRSGDAQAPVITKYPVGSQYALNETPTAIGVTATVADEGILTYQWYKDSVAIAGETNDSYTPNTSAIGSTSYYCEIKSTNQSVNGIQIKTINTNTVDIKVVDAPTLGVLDPPSSVKVGEVLTVTAPTINNNGALVTEKGWEISSDGGGSWSVFYPNVPMTYAMNGNSIRYWAENSVGRTVSNTATIIVSKLDITPSVNCSNINYGENVSTTVIGNTGGGTVAFEYKVQGAADSTYSTTVPTQAGSYTVRATIDSTDTYNGNSCSTNFTIAKATPVVTLNVNPGSGTLADDSVTLNITVAGVSPTDYVTGSVVIKDGSTPLTTIPVIMGETSYIWNNISAGAHDITAEYNGDGNYTSAQDTITGYDVQKREQTALNITGVPSVIVYGDDEFTLGTTGGDGSGTVTYSVESGDALSINGDEVTVEKAGTVVIKAVKAGDAIYNEVNTNMTITVAKRVPVTELDPSVEGANVGAPLSTLSLDDIKVYGAGDALLNGNTEWLSPQTIIDGAGLYTAVFTPADANHEAINFDVQINLDTTVPVIESITATPSRDGAVLEVVASAGTPMTYQWQVEGSWIDIPGGTTALYNYTGLNVNTGYRVRAIVTDANGNVTISDPIAFMTNAAVITGLPGSYTMSEGESVGFAPNPENGTWRYDKSYFSMKQEGNTYTFKALKAGNTKISYTAGGTEYIINMTIEGKGSRIAKSGLPKTGQNQLLSFAMIGVSMFLLGSVLVGKKSKNRK